MLIPILDSIEFLFSISQQSLNPTKSYGLLQANTIIFYHKTLLSIIQYSNTVCFLLSITIISFLSFLADLLDTFIRVSNYLDIIISWLYQHCSAKLKYTLVIFRIVFALKSSYFVLLELSKDKCYLHLVWINILRTFWRLSTLHNSIDFVQLL